jgi:hypothetical protein
LIRALLLLSISLAASAVLHAQDPHVLQLMEATWKSGAGAALNEYAALPVDKRTPALLVSVADQLLWTGKHAEASALLARAADENPLLTDVRRVDALRRPSS